MLSKILRKLSMVLIAAMAISTVNTADVFATEKVKYGAAIKDGKLYSLEIKENSVDVIPASTSNPVNDKYGDKYFITIKDRNVKVFDKFGNMTHYVYNTCGSTSSTYDSRYTFFDDEAGNKYMFDQKNGVIPYEYDYIDTVWDNEGRYYVVIKNEKKGLVDSKGKEIIPCEYDQLDGYTNNFKLVLFIGKKGEKKEYIFFNNNKSIIYDNAENFKSDFIVVRKNGKLGVVHNSGKEILKCEYDEIGEKYNGNELGNFGIYKLTKIKKKGKWGYVDKKGELKLNFQYDNAGNFRGKYAKVGKPGDWRFIDNKGREVYKFRYEDMGDFVNGRICAKKDGKWGVIDEKGKVIVPFSYHGVGSRSYSISGKLFSVMENGKWGLIDRNGKIIQDCKFDYEFNILHNQNGQIWIQTSIQTRIQTRFGEKHGILDGDGKEIYPAESDHPIYVDGDLAQAWKNNKIIAINRKGKVISPSDAISVYVIDGLAFIQQKVNNLTRQSALNSNGKEILATDEGFTYINGLFILHNYSKGKSGICNIKGKQILPAEYDEIYVFGPQY
jgi:hypothetical protein